MDFIHKQGFKYTVLTPQNILIENPETLSVKIADLGLVQYTDKSTYGNKIPNSTYYTAPEIIKG